MTIGYLHVGASEHGVYRYGAMLAEAARTYTDAEVVTAHAVLADTADAAARLDAALARLSGADVCHVQYEPAVWGGQAAPSHVARFCAHVPAPFVVTMHDARRGYGPVARMRRLWAARRAAQSDAASPSTEPGAEAKGEAAAALWPTVSASMRRAWRFWQMERANAQATRKMLHGAAAALVCTAPEQQRLAELAGETPLEVISHFVETRTLPDAAAARAALDIPPTALTVTVLGFIHRQKGHDRVVEALPHLPRPAQALFVGRPSDPDGRFAADLRARARTLGVADRVRITGYVDENTLNQYLAATDVAVCPFRAAAASGSLSTWIGAGRPIVASDLPLFAPYRAVSPDAFALVSPDAVPSDWARAIRRQHEAGGATALRNLQTRLALPTIIQRHMRWYTRAGAVR